MTPWIAAGQAPLSMEFSRQEYWSGLQFPSLGDLPDPEIELMSQCIENLLHCRQILYYLSCQARGCLWVVFFSLRLTAPLPITLLLGPIRVLSFYQFSFYCILNKVVR